ncbi:Inherit from arCOG: Periplasmic copper-binding protein [Seminavis robusta]|uniref:Inherit from arCOG: Periplasmic copper-binding protein n=1 Tax=Seminavis robusta TaxID=568900 RepID=A0A9N8DDZ6_9STRA|nr:Inherit from arCOG: Periplasmic copper-binding protein [Seminavis robusta]|eukprot:Sro49_g028800.1 Inherit from arCOG: Periplasmic copper-binding protein (816) ;mRNA; r:122384-125003
MKMRRNNYTGIPRRQTRLVRVGILSFLLIASKPWSLDAYLCDSLPEQTWEGFLQVIEGSSGGFALLCPFEISGQDCPSSASSVGYSLPSSTDLYIMCEAHYAVGPSQLNEVETYEAGCIIDCPGTHFQVGTNASLSIDSFVLRGSNNTAVKVNPNGVFSAFNSYFEANQNLNGNGGAIYAAEQSQISVSQTSFYDNAATNGGAIYLLGNAQIQNSAFTENSATSRGLDMGGGAIYAGQNSQLALSNSYLANNSAPAFGPAVLDLTGGNNMSFASNTACGNTATELFMRCNGALNVQNGIDVCSAFEHVCEESVLLTTPAPTEGSRTPSTAPSIAPTAREPSYQPSHIPSATPTALPSESSHSPSLGPTGHPSQPPSAVETTGPTILPSILPSRAISVASNAPSLEPSDSSTPTILSSISSSIAGSTDLPGGFSVEATLIVASSTPTTSTDWTYQSSAPTPTPAPTDSTILASVLAPTAGHLPISSKLPTTTSSPSPVSIDGDLGNLYFEDAYYGNPFVPIASTFDPSDASLYTGTESPDVIEPSIVPTQSQSDAHNVCEPLTAEPLPSEGAYRQGSISPAGLDLTELSSCGTVETLKDGGAFYSIQGSGAVMRAHTCSSFFGSFNFDTQIVVYRSTSGVTDDTPCMEDLECVVFSHDDFCGLHSSVSWYAEEGSVFYIYISDKGTNQATFHGLQHHYSLTVSPTPGGSCSASLALEMHPTSGEFLLEDPGMDVLSLGGSIWYKAEGSGLWLMASTCMGSLASRIKVYQGSCGPSGQLQEATVIETACGSGYFVTWLSQAGNTYYLKAAVEGTDGL